MLTSSDADDDIDRRPERQLILQLMENQQFNEETERLFSLLQERIMQLVQRCEELQAEKHALHDQIEELRSECRHLSEQHQRSRTRIDAMVARYNGLEQV